MTIFYNADEAFLDKYDLSEIAVQNAPNTSSWLSTISPLIGGYNTVKEWFTNFKSENYTEVPTTIRVCPGIGDLMRKSLLIKFHHDLLLETFEHETSFKWRVPEAGGNTKVEMHHPMQYISSKSNLFTDKINVKLVLPINFHCALNNHLMFLDPYYHTSIPYSVMPGLIQNVNGSLNETAINLLFPRKNETYYFKAGDPLCYLLNLNGDSKLKQKKNNTKLVRKTMLNNYIKFNKK